MFQKSKLGVISASLAITAAIALGSSGIASSAHAEAAADRAVVAVATTLGQESSAASEYAAVEYATVRSSEALTARVDMGIDASTAAPLSEGKRFSVFCVSMIASLALMLGVFGLVVRRRNSGRR